MEEVGGWVDGGAGGSNELLYWVSGWVGGEEEEEEWMDSAVSIIARVAILLLASPR